jgi:hypothetical protein
MGPYGGDNRRRIAGSIRVGSVADADMIEKWKTRASF